MSGDLIEEVTCSFTPPKKRRRRASSAKSMMATEKVWGTCQIMPEYSACALTCWKHGARFRVQCLLAHGAILNKNGVSVDQLRAILADFHNAGLEPSEVAMMDFARKIARSADEMTQADVDALRSLGLEDLDILDITLTATMRSFASKTFDALGAGPDPVYDGLERQLSDLLPA